MSNLKGIDISDVQKNVGWEKAKAAGLDFAILKCGFGADEKGQDEDYFERNVSECERLGIPWGAYLYSYAMSPAGAQNEVRHILRVLKGHKPSYPVIIDMEDADGYKERHGGIPSAQIITDILKAELTALESAGYYAGWYANKDWCLNHLYPEQLKQWMLWYARPGVAAPDRPCGIWQNQQGGTGGKWPGVSGACDLDVSYNDYAAVIKKDGLNGWEKAQAHASATNPAPVSAPAHSPTPARNTGNANIRTAQEFYNARGAGIAADGIWGPATRGAAIMSVQRGCNQAYGSGLAVDGIWGPRTEAAIRTLRMGSDNSAVYSLQAALMAHGYSVGNSGIDGKFGSRTEAAVRAFQCASGLTIDGLAGKKTFAALCK